MGDVEGEGGTWLLAELDDCLDSWLGAIETAGHGSYAAVAWEGRADQALRTSIHFGLVDPDDGRQRMWSIDANAHLLRALVEPDGEGLDRDTCDSTPTSQADEWIDTAVGEDTDGSGDDQDDGGAHGLFATPADVVLVPPDDQTASRSALAAGESLTQETLEDLLEGVPPPAEELVHLDSPLTEMLLDEGEPHERPADDDVELAWGLTEPTS